MLCFGFELAFCAYQEYFYTEMEGSFTLKRQHFKRGC